MKNSVGRKIHFLKALHALKKKLIQAGSIDDKQVWIEKQKTWTQFRNVP